jgi:hypothetical protein
MRIVTKAIVLLLLLTTTIFALNNKELTIIIDLSGKQRMLTQKMTKEAFLIKLGIDKESNIKKLKQSSRLFDKTLKGLLSGDKELKLVALKDSKIDEQLKKVDSIWRPFYAEIKNILNNSSSKKSYITISSKNEELLKEMDRAVELYTLQDKKSGFVLANDMNLAEKQRMLLQKMAKSLVVANNGIEVKKHRDEFLASQKLFDKTLEGLSVGDSSLKLRGTKLPFIKKQLEVVKKLWNSEQKKFKTALAGEGTKEAISALDNITIEMDKSVKLYTASLSRQQQRDEFASLLEIHNSLEKMDKKTKALIEKLAKAEVE